MTETKRDVFEKLLSEYVDDELRIDGLVYEPDQHIGELDREYFTNSYAAALPDDLPVVSKDVSNTMINYRFLWWKEFLDKAYDNELIGDEDINYKVRSESAEVARAWILGVWRVEETGEVVKLEEEG
ncbi:hypothetical protein LDK33_11845 [Furfurilactobacillus rossiae]|uniref:Uncharacterized protein n=2 Tax=Furfurilactobacillus milii TaxID=2888272 RepID=A0ABT6DCM8_9LACO|nr:hypothetical protein [Furfurilactobacillus milii]QLE66948.1 phage protein [Furfurilactobacillus rossiae]MCF6161958.1 hypothetical protein [Furfurilactobacillus milii]MCF6164338.1 hypothetical protein [Furfurilactobacillus milii]MDF9914826.1 hypothetical protein [Furfurilactobacillus milii]QLE69378.1 phage protein [Furfurilactobacillus rossiae]